MGILLGHTSAVNFWRLPPESRPTAKPVSKIPRWPSKSEQARAAHLLKDMLPSLQTPFHIVIPDPKTRMRSQDINTHLHSTTPPRSAFRSIGNGIFISSPELCFLQQAATLDFIELIVYGFELCGTYALDFSSAQTISLSTDAYLQVQESSSVQQASLNSCKTSQTADCSSKTQTNEKGFHCCPALTTTRKIRDLIDKMPHAHASTKAIKALYFVRDNSASPKETALALILGLPYRYGGFGLDMPTMNHRIDVRARNRKGALGSYFKCDLFWPEANLDVEYESTSHHTGSKRIAKDSKRRGSLDYLDIHVITVTAGQLYDNYALNKIAALIAKRLGKQIRPRCAHYDTKCMTLRFRLLYKI